MADNIHDPRVSIWVAPPKVRTRGSAPAGLSRDRIIRAAVARLDTEGVQAFSMRKLAADLKVTPMSVYWYVDNKDGLLELALDEAIGEMRIEPLADHGDWHGHLRALAHEYRRVFQRHPWAAQLAGQFLPLGPNSMLFTTSAVGAATRTGLPGDQLGSALGLIFQYAYGFALAEAQWYQRVHASGMSEDAFHRMVHGIIEETEPRFLENRELIEASVEGGVAASRDRQFTQGLDMALAGIDAAIAAREGANSGTSHGV